MPSDSFRRMTGNSEYRLSESLLEGYRRIDKDNEEENTLKINNIMFDSYIKAGSCRFLVKAVLMIHRCYTFTFNETKNYRKTCL